MVTIAFNLTVPRAHCVLAECEDLLYVVGGIDGVKHIMDIEGFSDRSSITTLVAQLEYVRKGPESFVYGSSYFLRWMPGDCRWHGC